MVQENIPEGHITLKEASRISGYAPDYVGQLIRKGRLYGKQIYYNTAWVTTEEALREYIAREKAGKEEEGATDRVQQVKNLLASEARLTQAFRAFLYILLSALILLAIILFYVLSVNIDRTLDRRAAEKAMQHAIPAR